MKRKQKGISLTCLWIPLNLLRIFVNQFVSSRVSVPLAVLFTVLHSKNNTSGWWEVANVTITFLHCGSAVFHLPIQCQLLSLASG